MTESRPGLLRRFFGGLWRLVDGARRLAFNLIFMAIVVGLAAAWLGSGPARLKDKTVLVLDLSGPLVEQRSGSAREQALQQVRGQPSAQVQLRDLLTVLDAAAKDEHIASVLLLLDDFRGAGLPSLREAKAAIERFRKASGKKVVAWGSRYDQRQYFVASAADEVLLHPMGAVFIEGYGRLRNYYRDAFDRLGVSANVIREVLRGLGPPVAAAG